MVWFGREKEKERKEREEERELVKKKRDGEFCFVSFCCTTPNHLLKLFLVQKHKRSDAI